MAMQVIWDDDASQKLIDALEYGRYTFGERIMEKFYARILEYEKLLQSNPRMGKKERKKHSLKKSRKAIATWSYIRTTS